jgi:hypothetical protein
MRLLVVMMMQAGFIVGWRIRSGFPGRSDHRTPRAAYAFSSVMAFIGM